MIQRVKVVIDVVAQNARQSLGDFRRSIAEADGITGKFKATWKGAGDLVKQNAAVIGTAAVGAGAALVGFAKSGIDAFTDLALEVGKFADATGLAAEDASRWIEVAGDIGIESSIVEKAFGKLNREIGNGSAELEKYGIGVVRAKDGTVDMNGTVLAAIETIGKIEDPTQRAAAGQAAFGRGWQEMAELIGMSTEDILANLESVSEQKVINDDEVRKAREYRASMDRLNDAIEDAQLEIGQKLVPALGDAVEGIAAMVEVANKLKVLDLAAEFYGWTTPLGLYGKLNDTLFDSLDHLADKEEELRAELERRGFTQEQINEIIADTAEATGEQADASDELTDATDELTAATDRARRANEAHARSVNAQRDAMFSALGSVFDYEKAIRATEQAAKDVKIAQAEYDTVMRNGTSTAAERKAAETKLRDAQIAGAEAALAQAEAHAAQKGALEGSTTSALLQREELRRLQGVFPDLRGDLQRYIDLLNQIPGVKTTQLVVTSSGSVTTKQTLGHTGRLVAGADGGVVTRPTMALIGEAGPEAVVPLDKTPGSAPLSALGGATTINQYFPAGTRPNDVVRALRRYSRRSGEFE